MSLHCHLTVLYRHLSSQYTSHTTVTTDFGAQWTGRYLMQAILGSPLYRKSLFGPISRTTHSTLHHQSVCLSVSCLTRETRAITSDVQQVWVQECVDSLLEIHYWWFSSVRLVHRQRGGALFELLPNQFQLHSTSNKLVPKVSLERSDHGYVTFLMAEMVLTSFKNDLKKGALRWHHILSPSTILCEIIIIYALLAKDY